MAKRNALGHFLNKHRLKGIGWVSLRGFVIKTSLQYVLCSVGWNINWEKYLIRQFSKQHLESKPKSFSLSIQPQIQYLMQCGAFSSLGFCLVGVFVLFVWYFGFKVMIFRDNLFWIWPMVEEFAIYKPQQ